MSNLISRRVSGRQLDRPVGRSVYPPHITGISAGESQDAAVYTVRRWGSTDRRIVFFVGLKWISSFRDENVTVYLCVLVWPWTMSYGEVLCYPCPTVTGLAS